MVRLETPSPGDRNPVRCRQVWDEMSDEEVNGGCYVCTYVIFVLQDLDHWLVTSDRYKARDKRPDGLVLYGRWSSDGSVKLQCLGKWHSVGSVAFRWLEIRKRETGLGQECRGRRECRSKWRSKETGQRNRDMAYGNWKEACGRWMSIQESKWKPKGKRVLVLSRKWCLESFCTFSDGRGRRRCMQTTAMKSILLGKMITCTWSEKRQTACETNYQCYCDTGQFATALGPTVTARETFPDPNDSIQYSPSLIPDKLGKGVRHARDVAHDLGKGSNHQSGAHGINKLQGLYGISHVDGRLNINEQTRKEKALSLVCGVETEMLTVDYDEIKNEGQGFAQDKTNTLGKERRRKHSRWPLTPLQQLWVLNRQKYLKLMEDEVTGLMENLRFTEEELKDVSIEGEEMMTNVEDADKWVVGKAPEFQGPFQFGEWVKVDLSKGRQNLRKKTGIIYANGKQELSRKEETGEHGMDSVEELERKSLQIERGKEVGPSVARSRTVKRSLKGKNEVCNPISAKKSKTFSNVVGDEDEISEASSPVKFSAQTVEAGS
ncbi:hypothetical protein V6N13_057287 [Hibiscus sabdariffa]|uniref:Uncharacterized protein n=2 Tax=Hibiscus sabdariffa TaxID=183260 RepID=A0ABR2NA40_9ROSI